MSTETRDLAAVPTEALRIELHRRAVGDAPRYFAASDEECGLLYRPGEMAIESLNYCRLARGHASRLHSTRAHRHDTAGFEWEPAEPDGMTWPED